jgi:hypothetical protein
MPVKHFIRFAATASVLALVAFSLSTAADPTAGPAHTAAASKADAVSKLVQAMGAPSFSTREAATRDLRVLLSGTGEASREMISRLFQFSLDPEVSFEAQQRLAELLAGIELPDSLNSSVATGQELSELVEQLSDDRFTTRETATRRLDWILRNPTNIVPALLAIKARLADAKLPAAMRQELTRHYDTVRRAWLLAPAKDCPLPAVGDEQIASLIETASAPAERQSTIADQQFAIRELQDLLCRDEYCEVITGRLKAAIESTNDPLATARLSELVDLTRPSMVAEIWSSLRIVNLGGGFIIADGDAHRMHLATMQYLHIGVPQVPENAPRATFFDRCDDKTAHCVSGNTLHPGDYPVGTAFLHPDGELTLFHLVNLPTPRRRLIYEYSASGSETVRFRKLSQKTCDAYLNKERPLLGADISILTLLDQAVVAQFAGRFFESIADAPLDGQARPLIVGPASLHGAICYALAFSGTRDAALQIIKAIDRKRFLPIDDGRYYDLPRIALLSIARRDAWADVNAWLGEQLSKKVRLIANSDPAPDLAATAAAILLERHGKSIDEFGLESNPDGFCQQIQLPTYRFRDDAARQAVQRWWQDKREVARSLAK